MGVIISSLSSTWYAIPLWMYWAWSKAYLWDLCRATRRGLFSRLTSHIYVSMRLDVVADLVKFIVKQDSPLALCQPTLQWKLSWINNYGDVIMNAMASQITYVSIVYSTVCSGTDQRKHQSSVSLPFVGGIHR